MARFTQWVSHLSPARKVVFGLATAGFVGLVAAAGSGSSQNNTHLQPTRPEASQQIKAETTTIEPTKPVVETKTSVETINVPFETTEVRDATLQEGKTAIKTTGIMGLKTLTYEQTFTDGAPGEKLLKKEEVTSAPVTQVIAVGTKKAPIVPIAQCDPNYAGACVPIASDVDCAGGSGNGPAYVSGPVTVTGVDIYDLDRDGNGVGCE